MSRALAWFAENHVAANLLMILLLLGGYFGLTTIKQEMIPEIALEMVTIQVPYPGASPEEVEEAICVRVEEAIQGIRGIKRVRSDASEGMGATTVELMTGEDVRARMDEIQTRVDLIDTFPEEAEEPRVQEVMMRNSLMSVAVSGTAGERTLKELGQRVRDEIAALPGITDVELIGARPYEIAIELSQSTMQRYDIGFDDVLQAVRSSSLDLPGGSIQTSSGEILLRSRGQAYSAEDFEGIALVSRRDGTRLTLGEIANVVDTFEETHQSASFDGGKAVFVQVYRVGDQKALELAERVHAYVERTSAALPEGLALTVWDDSSRSLRGRLDTMLRNARGGFILVVIILALFLRLRLALWVSVGIPVAFMGAIAMLPTLDVSINIISLMAFIVVLGIVVDDAIVVGESAHTEQLRTGSMLEGSILGTQKIFVPVFFGVLTTIAAFAPMLNLPGPMGRLTRLLPLVVITCLVFSLIEAIFILPAHLGHSRRDRDDQVDAVANNPISRGFLGIQARVAAGLKHLIEELYLPLLRRALEWRYLTVAVALSLLIVTLGMLGGGMLRFVFTTPVEADVIVADLWMPQGTPSAVTAQYVDRIEDAALAMQRTIDADRPGATDSVILHHLAAVGQQPFLTRQKSGPMGNQSARAAQGHLGEVQLEIIESKQRDQSAAELVAMWRERVGEIAGAEEISYEFSLIHTGEPIEVRLRGPELGPLREAAQAVQSRLSLYPGVFDIRDSFRLGKQELELQLLPAGEALGVTMHDLASQVRHAFYGAEAQSIQRGRDDVKVMVRYPEEERRSLANVESMRIRTRDGSLVPFSAIATARLGRGFSVIERVDRQRVVSVSADVDLAVATPNEIIADLDSGALAEVLGAFEGVSYSFEGEQADQREFLGALARAQMIAFFVIYALLAVPLRSYLQPLVIMSAIPFGLVGAALGHIVLGYDFNMYSVVGLVALSGVVVNASLVLVDAVNQLRREGADLEGALLLASHRRFRPIMLTSLTTFVGLTPLMLETSMQARFMIPMAISISFGVLFSSFITLFLVPVSCLVLNDLGRLVRQGLERTRTTPLDAPAPDALRG